MKSTYFPRFTENEIATDLPFVIKLVNKRVRDIRSNNLAWMWKQKCIAPKNICGQIEVTWRAPVMNGIFSKAKLKPNITIAILSRAAYSIAIISE